MPPKKTGDVSLEKLDRKTVERNRRILMKGLCLRLTSLIPSQHFKPSKDMLSLPDQLDQAGEYIKQLKERVDELNRRKIALTRRAMESATSVGEGSTSNAWETGTWTTTGLQLPTVELREVGSSLVVSLINGLRQNVMLYEAITILEQEGAEVVSASFSTVGSLIYQTIHAQARVSRVGIATSRVYQRLQELFSA